MGIELHRDTYLSILVRAIQAYRDRGKGIAKNLCETSAHQRLLPQSYYHQEFILNEKRARQLEQVFLRTQQEEMFVLADLNVIDLINNSGVAQL